MAEKFNRCSIKAHNWPLIEELKKETGVEDLTELINYVLIGVKQIRASGVNVVSLTANSRQKQAPQASVNPAAPPEDLDDFASMVL